MQRASHNTMNPTVAAATLATAGRQLEAAHADYMRKQRFRSTHTDARDDREEYEHAVRAEQAAQDYLGLMYRLFDEATAKYERACGGAH